MIIPENYYFFVDILVLIIMALSVFIGYKRGFIYQLIDLFSFLITILLAWFLSPLCAKYMPILKASDSLVEQMTKPIFNIVIWFIIIVIVFKIILAIILPFFKGIKKIPVLGSINAVGGLLSGFINGLIWILMFGLFLNTPIIKNGQDLIDNSIYKSVNFMTDRIILEVYNHIDEDMINDGFSSLEQYRDSFENWLIDEGIFNE